MANEWNQGTFQFDAPGLSHTFTFALDRIQSALTQSGWELASWSPGASPPAANARYLIRTDRNTQDRWQYTGDTLTQHGGILLWYDSDPQTTTGLAAFAGQVHIVIQSFLENTGATDVQVASPDWVETVGGAERFGSIRIVLDSTAVNNYLIYCGEDGLYIESGRDGVQNNLGHGAIMTFGAIPELHGTLDANVKWTAQGLVCDFSDVCRFSADRFDRFVTNDGTDKNFTASLQPYTPRGTYNIDSTGGGANIADQREYYIGAQDNFFSLGSGNQSTSITTNQESQEREGQIRYAATFGLINTPKNNRFRIAPLVMIQDIRHVDIAADSSSSDNNLAPSADKGHMIDWRQTRRVFKFAAVDYTLLPFVNITDAVTGVVYRVARMEDNGRFSQFGVQQPTTPPLTL